jgi:glycosyl hydrolase family 12
VKSSFPVTALLCLSSFSLFAAACSSSDKTGDDDSAGTGNQSGTGSGAGPATGGSGPAAGGTGAQAGGQGGANAGTAGAGALPGQGGSAAGGSGSGGAAGAGAAPATGGTGQSGAGGSATAGVGGAGAAAGTAGTAGAGMAGSAGSGNTGDGTLGNGLMMGMNRSSEQYATAEVSRNGVPYILITNGWGPGFESHTISWNGTSFIVEAMMGSRGSGGQPASYPSVFCGKYSVMEVPACGLPKPIDQITSLKTGWRWAANGNTTAYNAAYDIWLGTATGFGMYLMVWLRDPPGEQPAGSPNAMHQGISVTNVPGTWDIWTGTVNNRPIINWVRHEGSDSSEIEFDVMDFIRDAQTRGLTITGTQVNAVAVGFEIWQGPITNLETKDFYVDVK